MGASPTEGAGERGRLIALEGIDGSGKTTQARLLTRAVGVRALSTAEPGATATGARLRALLLDPDLPPVAARTEALLLAADRAEHVTEIVAPALDSGRWVITDRFSGSTLAYQGYGRGLDLDALRWLVDWATSGLTPDLNVLVDVPLAVARDRCRGAQVDRLERLGDAFHERVRDGYRALAGAEPGRWVVVDGASDVDTVAARLRAAVEERVGPFPAVVP